MRPLPFTIANGRVVPTFLGPQDIPWLARLLDEASALAGRPEFAARERFRLPLPGAASPAVWQLTVDIVLKALRAPLPAVPPRAIRGRLCAARAAWPDVPRADLVARVAGALAMSPAALDAAFVADLPGQRALAAFPADPAGAGPAAAGLTAAALVPAVNLEVARAVLRHALSVAIEAEEGVRTIVRVAHLCGLICSVPAPTTARAPVVFLSGPLAVLAKTTAYGRAFGALLPRLPWCGRYRLRARCLVEGREARFELTSSDAILPAAPPRAFDSRVEERFAKDVRRLAPEWDLVREPAAFRAGDALVFPDFALRPRTLAARPGAMLDARTGAMLDAKTGAGSNAGDRAVYVEIVGYWTSDYLERKLARLRAARIAPLIVCLDAALQCDASDIAGSACDAVCSSACDAASRDAQSIVRVVPFMRGRVDALAVLAAARALLGVEPG